MTDAQKEKILSMRKQGIGYYMIGKAPNLKENQVQLYCETHGLAGDAQLTKLNRAVWCEKNNRCMFCNEKLVQKSTAGGENSAPETAAPNTTCCVKSIKRIDMFAPVFLSNRSLVF